MVISQSGLTECPIAGVVVTGVYVLVTAFRIISA